MVAFVPPIMLPLLCPRVNRSYVGCRVSTADAYLDEAPRGNHKLEPQPLEFEPENQDTRMQYIKHIPGCDWHTGAALRITRAVGPISVSEIARMRQ